MNAATIEWARVSPAWVVVATPERSWVHAPSISSVDDPFLGPMERGMPGGEATTRMLLDGAIGAARMSVERGPAPPAMSPSQWIWRLVGYWRTTEVTPRLLRDAAHRFANAGRSSLGQWATQRAAEEEGHDRLALRDLESLGLDAEAVVRALEPETACALAAHFTRLVAEEDPIGCVGYSYALERLALGRDQKTVSLIQSFFPSSVDVTRCLRVHSAAGSDAQHVAETIKLVASLASDERAQVVADCFETARIYYQSPASAALTDAEIEARVAPYRRA